MINKLLNTRIRDKCLYLTKEKEKVWPGEIPLERNSNYRLTKQET